MAHLKTRIIAVAALSISPFLTGCYIAHVTKGQLDIMRRSISVEDALKRDDLSGRDKARLRLIQDIRAFAETDLGLKKSRNYSTYLVGPKRPIYWVVTASYKDRLEAVTVWLPVVGRVEQRGFYSREEAEKVRDQLAKEGHDAYLRVALGYSTLGWFTDPVTPQMLDLDEGYLAFLIIHELTHNTVFVRSQATFSESLAVFVGREGARQFLLKKFGPMSAEAAAYAERLHDERLYDGFMTDSATKLKALYASKPTDLEAARRGFFNQVRRDFELLRPRFSTAAYRRISLGTLNNAFFIGFLVYADTAPFERLFAVMGRSWPKFLEMIRDAAKHDDPMARLRELAR